MDKRSQHLALFTLCIFFGAGLGGIQVASAGGEWCVAKQGASDIELRMALEYACSHGGTDCSAIQPGAICFIPYTLRDHASYAFNQYYQNNPQPASCVFAGVAQLTTTDPSHGNCHYASAGTSISPPTPGIPPSKPTPTPSAGNPPAPGSPPSKPTPTPSVGNPPTHGSPPTQPTPLAPTPPSPGQKASPSGATATSFSLMVFLACGLLASLQLAKSI